MPTARHTHQTTLRFTEELWRQLQTAADAQMISVAQYVRDAARARLARERRQEAPETEVAAALRQEVVDVRQRSLDEAESTAALWEQGRLARERAALLREQAREWRGARSR